LAGAFWAGFAHLRTVGLGAFLHCIPERILALSLAQRDLAIDPAHCRRQMKRQRVRVNYSGRVQGVGFRYTVKSLAAGFEVCGTVRNLLDGRVELVSEGLREELEAFLAAIRDSGLGHFVRNEHVEWLEATGEIRGFQITG
jgi:acylphosphatase